ncbi:hypothetical protein NLI96_g5459 [Meripilus lineatus]|uniref:Uncharacterized protein n=1 Tax=Meripilus lineatus TaxID=2056292 RepID=A0AAD5YGX8_9APHY|nr:hypothetical protein NLI96_g5459 [Physisporinus lineatus]
MQLHPQPQARKVTPTQAISNTDTITDSEQTTYITQHYESGQSYQYKAQVDPCGVGEGNALQLMTQADDPAPFSRPGPHVIRQPGDLHYYMSVSPHNDLEVNRYDHLSSSPLSNTRGQHSPATPPNEADGFWMSAHDGSLDHHSLLSPPCSPHRLGSSPSRVTSQELAYYDPISKPDYECDLDYSSLDFKWEKFPRDGLVALSARDERLDHPEFVEENPTAEETHNEVVLLPPGTSSESSPHFGFFRREIREVPVTPVRKSRHTQADTLTEVSVVTAATIPHRLLQDQENQLSVQRTSHEGSSNTTPDVHSKKGSSGGIHESNEGEVVDEISSSQHSNDTIESWSNVKD